jgi:hypothetical protein
MVFQLPYKVSIYDSNFFGENMSKKEPEQIHSYWIKAENGKITHYYRATKSIIESEVKLLEPDDLEVKKLEDKVIELLQKN